MLYFLYHSGYETGETLSTALMEKMGPENLKVVTSLARLRRSHLKAGDSLIRWGSTRRDYKDEFFTRKGGIVLNPAKSIIANTNKLNSLKVFKSAGLNTPRVYTNKYDIEKFPVLGRDRNHHGGLDIVIIKGSSIKRYNDYDKIPDKDFYSEFVPSRDEYRVHVFNGNVTRVTRKVFRGHDRGGKIAERGLIKNDTYGWGHQSVEIEDFDKDFADDSVRAVQAMGLTFGAVDLLICSRHSSPYVLEVNSCPRLNTIGLDVYSDLIADLFGSKVKKEKYYW